MKKLLLTIGLAGCIALNINAQTQPPNGGFETWVGSGSSIEPTNWGTFNQLYALGVAQTAFQATGADAYSGTYSLKLESVYDSFLFLDTIPGVAGLNTDFFASTEGMAYTDRPDSMKAFIKGTVIPGDTCIINAQLFNLGTLVGEATYTLTTSIGSYTEISVAFNYFLPDTPDTLLLSMSAGGLAAPIQQGNILFIDELSFVFPPPPPCGIDSSQIAVIIETGGFGSEVSWSITNAAGTQIDTGFGYASTTTYYDTLCIKDCESYDFNMYDSFGDGWNGGIYTIVQVSTGDTLSSGGMLGGSSGSDPFSFCNLPDAGITDILSPVSGCLLSASETIEVVIQNYSTADTINSVDVSYSIDGGPAVTETVTGTILPGNSMNYVFSALADLSAPGLHTIDAWTDLLSDANNTNDSLNGYMVNNNVPSSSFNDSIYISDAISEGIQATICTNGLVSNMLDSCYQLTAVVIDSLFHTWTSDLEIYLIAPNNDTLELSTNNGGSGNNYYNVVFTDTASINISTISSGGFGAGGYYHTENTAGLASFTGFDPNGAWILWITDVVGGDDGTIYKWHLEFTDTTLDAGTPGTLNVCDTETAVDLLTGLGGTPDGSGTWNDDDTTGALTGGIFDASLAGAGVYNFTYFVTGCVNDSATVTVTVATGPNPGISDSANVCGSDFTYELATGLGGTPDGGGTWNDDDSSGAIILFGNILPPLPTPGTYNFTYTVSGTSPCTDASATVTLTITAPLTGGLLSACIAETALDLFTGLGSTPATTGTWNDDNATGALTGSIFNAFAAGVGTYNFTYTIADPAPCADTTATVTVTVVGAPNAGTDGTLAACDADFTLDLTTGLGGTPDSGGTWNDDDASGAILFGSTISPALAGAGTFNFTYVVSASGCADDSATVTLNVTAAPNAGADSTLNTCDTVTVNLFTFLGGTPDAGGTWLDDNATGALTGGVFNPSGMSANTYNFTYVVSASSCADDSTTVSVTVSICTGISEMLSFVSMNIYPNPNKGPFIVEVTNTKKEDYLIEVRNIIGQLVYSEQIDDVSGSFIKEIDLSGRKGVYFLSISSSSGTRTEKLIVY